MQWNAQHKPLESWCNNFKLKEGWVKKSSSKNLKIRQQPTKITR